MSGQNLQEIQYFAEELADIARQLAMEQFRSTSHFERKLDESPVTAADRSIETAMRTAIEKRFPSHGNFGEETGATGSKDALWVLDPIDGTKSFITGIPLFGALIASLTLDALSRASSRCRRSWSGGWARKASRLSTGFRPMSADADRSRILGYTRRLPIFSTIRPTGIVMTG